jgi:adenosylhomocysteine nucleosidase
MLKLLWRLNMIGLIVAMEREAESVIPYIKDISESKIAGKKVIKGKLFDKEIVLIITGIGKVSSALSAQLLIDNFNPEVIINFGSVGAVNSEIKVGDYVIVEKACQFDFDLREIDPVPLGYNQDYDCVFFKTHTLDTLPYKKVALGTSDKFTSKKEIIEEIIKMGIDIRDMEGCAIAQVCNSNNAKLIMLKGITDVYGLGTDGEQFVLNLKKVSQGFPNQLKTIFENI